jgi:hypothetical protein
VKRKCVGSLFKLQFCRGRSKVEKAGGRGCALRRQNSGGVDRLRHNSIGEKLAPFSRLFIISIIQFGMFQSHSLTLVAF